MLCQCCIDIVMLNRRCIDFISILYRCVDVVYRCYYRCCIDVVSTLYRRCIYVVSTLYRRCIDVVSTLSTLYRRCIDVCVVSTLYRRCIDVVSTLYRRCIDVVSTLYRRCIDVVSTLYRRCIVCCCFWTAEVFRRSNGGVSEDVGLRRRFPGSDGEGRDDGQHDTHPVLGATREFRVFNPTPFQPQFNPNSAFILNTELKNSSAPTIARFNENPLSPSSTSIALIDIQAA